MALTKLIAEVGVNHNGSIEMAKALIDICGDAGVDIIKFQTFSTDKLVSRTASKAKYQIEQDGAGNQYDMLKRLELSMEDFYRLNERCISRDIEFLSTAFDEVLLAKLVEMGMSRIKIASGEITNLPYLRTAASFGLPMIISTGMSTFEEIEAAVSVISQAGLPADKLTILHCTSSYPAADADLNLNVIKILKEYFGVSIGYSDHSNGIQAAIMAATLGAEIIEKHVTLNKTLSGPDHMASIEPDELKLLVTALRRVDMMLGSQEKRPSKEEKETLKLVRKSIVAKTSIRRGEKLTGENLTVKRPASGLTPMLWDKVIGTRAIKNFEQDENIVLSDDNDD